MSNSSSDSSYETGRTATSAAKQYGHRVMSMDAIGLIMFVLLFVISLPLLPFVVIGWVLLRLMRAVGRNAVGE